MAGLNSQSPMCCCLCCTDISLAKGIRKHKKHNGASCASEREVLDIAMQNSGVDIEVVQKNFEGGITICYGCSLKLKNQKVRGRNGEIKERGSQLPFKYPAAEATGTTNGAP